MLIHELESAIKSYKEMHRSQGFNVDEYEVLAKDFIDYINNLDLSTHTKGNLHMMLQRFYRDVMLNEILKREVSDEGRNED